MDDKEINEAIYEASGESFTPRYVEAVVWTYLINSYFRDELDRRLLVHQRGMDEIVSDIPDIDLDGREP